MVGTWQEYVRFLRYGVGAVVMTMCWAQGLRGLLLAPLYICLVTAAFCHFILEDLRPMVLYAQVILEKCQLLVPLGLEESGKELTKRVARLPKEPVLYCINYHVLYISN